jgi:hypothetical protein
MPKILCIDFDGVIHDYMKGWQDGSIYGEVVPGFFEWALQACRHFQLVIYSSRSKQAAGVIAMSDWLVMKAHAEGWQPTDEPFDNPAPDGDMPMLRLLHARAADVIVLYFAHEKPPAWLTIDDRSIQFEGRWEWVRPEVLLDFKPWNSR